ncbi:unnamed protein product [Medioppia subpectinata]|uniref:Rieske domain-containing protein n=1 Tax=Medioppia subpectinata TaxID=1979941 RepID=A0A7R9Q0H6_9ACAR|nr:unnamed protein product [Medioppia subpectinata]CAG2107313.1 unnamed protein product [Medioppia subpectinata]
MTSSQLPVNGVKPFEMCGQQLVAFRGATGAVHVLSAYCPHLGANLGVGGHVVTESESGDDCIQCPFHGWRFGGDGQCKRIPKIENLEHFGYVHHVLIPNVLTLDFEFDTDYGDGPVPIITGITTLKLFGRKLLRMRTTSRKESPVQEMVSFGYIHVNAVQVPLSHDRTFIIIGLYGSRCRSRNSRLRAGAVQSRCRFRAAALALPALKPEPVSRLRLQHFNHYKVQYSKK